MHIDTNIINTRVVSQIVFCALTSKQILMFATQVDYDLDHDFRLVLLYPVG